jgi:23S rRNA (adenine2503-C2)-methyltransferase
LCRLRGNRVRFLLQYPLGVGTVAPQNMSPHLYAFTRAELIARFGEWALSPVHAARLWSYLYGDLAESFDAMPELPASVKARLVAETRLGVPPAVVEQESSDGFTRKFLLSLGDEARIETVLMRFAGRVTACVSSQVGCAMGCTFCATGQMGYARQLTSDEIVAQVVHVARQLRALAPARSSAVRQRGTPGGRAMLATRRSAMWSSWGWASRCTTMTP